jgi:hypothetical protein
VAQVGADLLDLRTLAADDDARTRGVDDQADLAAGALDLQAGDTGLEELLLDELADLVIGEDVAA